MPKTAKELGALAISKLKHPGGEINRPVNVAAGGVSGLLLQISSTNSRSWLLRTMVGGKRKEIGLGAYPEVSLKDARDRAKAEKLKIKEGVDPVEQRKIARATLLAAQKRGLTFSDAINQYLDSKLDEFKNEKHKQQWRTTLDSYARPLIGSMLVADIDVHDVLRVIEPIWMEKTETASRLRGRIENVLAWAAVKGYRTGDNPARWQGNLKETLPAPSKVADSSHHPAVQVKQVADWYAALKKREGVSAIALEYLILTTARSGEVRGTTWDEVDLVAGLWTVPAKRMKANREHRVPLCARAIAILQSLNKMKDSDYIFAAPRGGMLSDMSLSAVMRRMHESEVEEGRIGSERLMNSSDNKRGLTGRDIQGRFAIGNSGRPLGAKGKASREALELVKQMKYGAIDKLREAVTKGERWAIEFVLAKVLPAGRTVEFEDISIADITAALKSGDITTEEAKAIADTIRNLREVESIESIQNKLKELEEAVNDDK